MHLPKLVLDLTQCAGIFKVSKQLSVANFLGYQAAEKY